jgi:hypothetical protein
MDDGCLCQAAALRGREFCAAHVRLRERRWRMMRARRRIQARFEIPPLVDLWTVRLAMVRVRVALASGLIERRTAGLMFYGLRMAASNLRYMELRDEYSDFGAEEMEAERRSATPPNSNVNYCIHINRLE